MSTLFDAVIHGSIENRYLVLCAAVALFGAGIWAAPGAHLDALPDFTPPTVIVQAEAPGLGSSAVEELVTTPLEQVLLGMPGVEHVRSTSSSGLSVIQMAFEEGTDIFQARQLVSEHVAEAKERLPAQLPAPRLAPITAPVGALLKLAFTLPTRDEEGMRQLWRFAQWRLRPRLEALSGVSRVTVHGGSAAQVEVRPDPAAMLARHVDLADLREALGSAQSLAALGHAVAGAQQQAVRADGTWSLDRIAAVADTTVARGADGIPVRVADVAAVTVGQAPAVGTALYDGEPAIYLQIDKLPWADTLEVTRRAESVLEELDSALPAGARRQPPLFRQADFIRTSLFAMGRAMVLGAVFVVVILLLFLRSPRLSAISLTALPLSIVAAATVLVARGVTINGMILGGLAIAVGEVVDDAIVDVENIWRRLRESRDRSEPRRRLEVIRDASAEVRGAVVYASLIVVAVLLPVILLGGVAGRIFSPLAEAYALAIGASLLVALTVTPAMAAVMLPRLAAADVREPRATRWLRRSYERVLQVLRRRPGRIVVIAACLGVVTLIVLPLLGGAFLPEFREGVLIAEVAAWPGTSLTETTRLAERLSQALLQESALSHVAVRVGRASLDEDAAPVHRMEVDLVLSGQAGDPEETGAAIRDRIATFVGLRSSVEGFLGERIDELLSGERAPIAVKIRGGELPVLRRAAARLLERITAVDGVLSARAAGLADAPTVDLVLDERRLAASGARRSDVVDAVAAWRQGLPVTEVRVPGGFSVPVVISGGARFQRRDQLAGLPVFTSSSTVLPVSALARLEETTEPPSIDHEDGRRLVTITARPEPGDLSAVAGRVERIAATELGDSVSWTIAGQAAERQQARGRLVIVGALVLTAVFAFLWMAFGSLVDAGVVLGGLPLGMVGGVIAALLMPEGLSMAGLVGFVALSGIIARNGIMLVAHKNQLIGERGEESEELVLQAARERLLPIVLTASTAFFGLLPLAASIGAAGSELESPMALVVCGGLVTATTLNLVAVPAFYLWRVRRGTARAEDA